MDTTPAPQGAAPAQTPVSKKENARVFLFGFLGLIVVVAVVAVGAAAYRVYTRKATDSFTLGVARFLNLPAFVVNGVGVRYTDYISDFAAITTFRTFSNSEEGLKASGGQRVTLTDEELSDQVLNRLASNVIVAQAAKKFNLTVSDDEVAGLVSELLKQFQTETNVNSELLKRYGWDLSAYKAKVMRPYLLQKKVGEAIVADPAARAKIRQSAEAVLKELKDGADFAALAKKYGEDGTAEQGGELGWFKRGDMVPQFETAVFALKIGEMSAEPVESPFGYHLIKLEERKTTKAKDASGKTVTEEQVRARHILFRFSTFEEFLADALKNAQVKLYIPVHNPFTAPTSTPAS